MTLTQSNRTCESLWIMLWTRSELTALLRRFIG
jgi:hypothetical protein